VVTDSGLASVVISTPGAMPNRSPISRTITSRCSAGSNVGVPPPKKIVDTGGTPRRSTSRARRSSRRTVSA